MHRIYTYATDEQIKLKIKVMRVAVQESIDITKSTTLVQRMQSVLFIPRNRRALSMLYPPLINILLILSSYCLWPSGFPAIVWIQYTDVLFCNTFQINWIQSTNGSWNDCCRYKLLIHFGCIEIHRYCWS